MGAKLIFKQLFLFSSTEKKARKIEFSPGKTIITSSKVDGTDRGKSVVLKSLYHTMGADCFFEDKWDDKGKTYILLFEIDGIEFLICRFNRLFKLFDSIWSVKNRYKPQPIIRFFFSLFAIVFNSVYSIINLIFS